MSCMPFLAPRRSFQLHAVVEQPVSVLCPGKITCRPVGPAPIVVEWSGPRGTEIQLDETRCEAYGLDPGRYTVRARDGEGARATLTVDVRPVLAADSTLVVCAYETTPASSGSARDGSIRALGHGLAEWRRFLWSNGVETEEAVLKDVREGTYFVSPLPLEGRVPLFVQRCAPGEVGVGSLLCGPGAPE